MDRPVEGRKEEGRKGERERDREREREGKREEQVNALRACLGSLKDLYGPFEAEI